MWPQGQQQGQHLEQRQWKQAGTTEEEAAAGTTEEVAAARHQSIKSVPDGELSDAKSKTEQFVGGVRAGWPGHVDNSSKARLPASTNRALTKSPNFALSVSPNLAQTHPHSCLNLALSFSPNHVPILPYH